MRKFKRAAALLMASTMVLSMAACSSGDNNDNKSTTQGADSTGGSSAADGAAADRVAAAIAAGGETEIDNKAAGVEYEACTLTFSWWGGDSRQAATEEAIKAFEEKYPGIKIQPTYAAWGGWEDKMATLFATNTAYDINQVNWNWLTSFSSDGSKFVDLSTDEITQYLDLSQYDEKVLSQCIVANELQAVPISMTGRIFYWDKTTFDEAGIGVPTSYEELLAAGNTFKEKLGDDYYPLSLGEYDRMILMVYYLESVYGKAWVENNTLQYTAEEIKTGFEFLQTLEENHVTPTVTKLIGDGASSLDQNSNWITGKYAGIFEWDSSAEKFSKALEQGREFVVGSYFEDFGDYHGGYSKVSMAFAISETCAHPKEAAMFINFMLNEKEGVVPLGSERGIPASKSALAYCQAWDEENAEEIASNEDVNAKLSGLTVEANGKVLAWVDFPLDPYFEDSKLKGDTGVYYDVMDGIAYDDYDLDTAAEVLIEGINSVLNGSK
ncbi:MAG: ABC transporter substrate-binding protein [Lachnospiraceae bacterium]